MNVRSMLLTILFVVFSVTLAVAQGGTTDAPRGSQHVARSAAAEEPVAPAGRVTTLPADDEGRQRSELLAGHIYLFGKTLDQAIDDLQNSDLKAFAKSYQHMVASYGQLADQVGDASQSLGDAANQVVLAKHALANVGSGSQASPERKVKLAEEIGQIRAMLIGKLGSVRARLEGAHGEQRQPLLAQVKGLVERVQQLDRMDGALRDGTQPLLPGLAAEHLNEQLDTIANALEEERQMLGVVSESVRLLVTNTSAEMRRTMRLLQIETQIPNGQVKQLLETRAAVQHILDEVTAAHRRASHSALNLLASDGADVNLEEEGDLLRVVDLLIDGNHDSTP